MSEKIIHVIRHYSSSRAGIFALSPNEFNFWMGHPNVKLMDYVLDNTQSRVVYAKRDGYGSFFPLELPEYNVIIIYDGISHGGEPLRKEKLDIEKPYLPPNKPFNYCSHSKKMINGKYIYNLEIK